MIRAWGQERDPYASVAWRERAVALGRFLVIGLIVGLALGLYAMFRFRGLSDPAVMEQAVIARNLAEGRGLVTDIHRPLDAGLQGDEVLPGGSVRSRWQAPGYPVLLSWLLRLVRPAHAFSGSGLLLAEVEVMVPLGILLFLLSIWLVWLIGCQMYDADKAKVAFIVYAVSWLPLQGAMGGGAAGWVLVLVPAVVYAGLCALHASTVAQMPLRTLLWAAAGGFAAGLLLLADTAMGLLMVGVGVLLATELQRTRWLGVACFVLVSLVVWMPWFLQGGALAYPYLFLQGTDLYPGEQLFRSEAFTERAWRVAAAVRGGIADRMVAFVTGRTLWQAGLAGLFFVVALFRREEQAHLRTLKIILLVLLVLAPVFPSQPGSAWQPWMGYYPLMVLFGVGAFLELLEREEYFDVFARPFLTMVFIAVCALPAGLALVRGEGTNPYPPYYGPLQAYVGDLVEEDTWLVTDIPWATAWYGRRQSLLLPQHPDALVGAAEQTVGGIYLTGRYAASAGKRQDGDRLWQLMYVDQQVPADFPFAYGMYLPAETRDQLVLLQDPLAEPQE